jgi:hypothetical protein
MVTTVIWGQWLMLISLISAIFADFGKKMASFLKTNVMIQTPILHNLHSSVLNQRANFLNPLYSEIQMNIKGRSL